MKKSNIVLYCGLRWEVVFVDNPNVTIVCGEQMKTVHRDVLTEINPALDSEFDREESDDGE